MRDGDLAGVRRLADEDPGRPDAAGPDGRTPLMLAAPIGAEDFVTLLLELGGGATAKAGTATPTSGSASARTPKRTASYAD